MNYKFLPIGGTDLWSHYPTTNSFTNDLLMPPAAEDLDPAHQEAPVSADGEDVMIGSSRAAGSPAADWMVGSPHAADAPTEIIPTVPPAPAEAPGDDAWARYEAAVAALEQHTYSSPFTDTMMAGPPH